MPRVIPHQQSATWYSQSDTDAAQPEKIVCNNRTAYNLAPEALLSPRMEGDCVRGMRGAVVLFQEVTEGEKLDKNLAKKIGERKKKCRETPCSLHFERTSVLNLATGLFLHCDFPFFFTLAARLVDINNPATMSQTRVNLAAAKRELAERQDEANLCMVELRHAQEIMAAGGTGPKVLSVRSEREREGKGKG